MKIVIWLLCAAFLGQPTIHFREPADFPDLPKSFRAQLERAECRIPQAYDPNAPANVISGSFARSGQQDWAVLCSVKGKSRIVVFWGGAAHCSSEMEVREDSSFMQSIGKNRKGYSRVIGAVGPKLVAEKARQFEAKVPFTLHHDGIEDFYWGKASGVLYCHEGAWHKFPGSD